MGVPFSPTENCIVSNHRVNLLNVRTESEQWKYWIILFDCAPPHICYILRTKHSTSQVGPRLRSGAKVKVTV